MDEIGRWLKSLRLHKYTLLFQQLTYDQMLNLNEDYLIEQNVTKGARNKMLVSVKKLNLRTERLTNMIEDLNRDNISLREALTVLKDIIMTPIPPPKSERNFLAQQLTQETTPASSNLTTPSATSTSFKFSKLSQFNSSTTMTASITSPLQTATDPYDLTNLFVETLHQVALRFFSTTVVDSACHGIMATIVDECIKHKSFTKAQKELVASYKHYLRQRSNNNHRSASGFSNHNSSANNGYHYNANHYFSYSNNYSICSLLNKASPCNSSGGSSINVGNNGLKSRSSSSTSSTSSSSGICSSMTGGGSSKCSNIVVGNAVSKRQYNQNLSTKHLIQENDHSQTSSNIKQDRGQLQRQLQAQWQLDSRQLQQQPQQVPLYLSKQHLAQKPRIIMPIQPPSSFSSSPASSPLLSPVSSLSSTDSSSFAEYTLLGPAVATFELPCLRLRAAQQSQQIQLGAARSA